MRTLIKKGKKLINEERPKISKLRRWVDIMTDLKKYHEYREEIQLANGGDIRCYLYLEKKAKKNKKHVRKKKMKIPIKTQTRKKIKERETWKRHYQKMATKNNKFTIQ